MRLVLVTGLTLILSAVALAAPASAQVNAEYSKLSKEITLTAEAALKRGDHDQAQFQFERALLADPANIKAMLGLGLAHEAQGRVGRALKYYRQTLDLAPNHIPAIKAQALAFLKRDLSLRAKRNLDRLSRLCDSCAAQVEVKAALDSYMAEQSLAQSTPAEEGTN